MTKVRSLLRADQSLTVKPIHYDFILISSQGCLPEKNNITFKIHFLRMSFWLRRLFFLLPFNLTVNPIRILMFPISVLIKDKCRKTLLWKNQVYNQNHSVPDLFSSISRLEPLMCHYQVKFA